MTPYNLKTLAHSHLMDWDLIVFSYLTAANNQSHKHTGAYRLVAYVESGTWATSTGDCKYCNGCTLNRRLLHYLCAVQKNQARG